MKVEYEKGTSVTIILENTEEIESLTKSLVTGSINALTKQLTTYLWMIKRQF